MNNQVEVKEKNYIRNFVQKNFTFSKLKINQMDSRILSNV